MLRTTNIAENENNWCFFVDIYAVSGLSVRKHEGDARNIKRGTGGLPAKIIVDHIFCVYNKNISN